MNRRNHTLQAGLALVVCVLAAGGCDLERKQTKSRRSIDTEPVDVGGPIDSSLSTEADMKASAVGGQADVVLPKDFPRDLPVYAPASMTAFGVGGGGTAYVVLESPDPASFVRSRYVAELEAAGWQSLGNDVYSRAGKEVRIGVREVLPVTEIHIEYRSAAGS